MARIKSRSRSKIVLSPENIHGTQGMGERSEQNEPSGAGPSNLSSRDPSTIRLGGISAGTRVPIVSDFERQENFVTRRLVMTTTDTGGRIRVGTNRQIEIMEDIDAEDDKIAANLAKFNAAHPHFREKRNVETASSSHSTDEPWYEAAKRKSQEDISAREAQSIPPKRPRPSGNPRPAPPGSLSNYDFLNDENSESLSATLGGYRLREEQAGEIMQSLWPQLDRRNLINRLGFQSLARFGRLFFAAVILAVYRLCRDYSGLAEVQNQHNAVVDNLRTTINSGKYSRQNALKRARESELKTSKAIRDKHDAEVKAKKAGEDAIALRAEIDALKKDNEFLKRVNRSLEASNTDAENAISNLRRRIQYFESEEYRCAVVENFRQSNVCKCLELLRGAADMQYGMNVCVGQVGHLGYLGEGFSNDMLDVRRDANMETPKDNNDDDDDELHTPRSGDPFYTVWRDRKKSKKPHSSPLKPKSPHVSKGKEKIAPSLSPGDSENVKKVLHDVFGSGDNEPELLPRTSRSTILLRSPPKGTDFKNTHPAIAAKRKKVSSASKASGPSTAFVGIKCPAQSGLAPALTSKKGEPGISVSAQCTISPSRYQLEDPADRAEIVLPDNWAQTEELILTEDQIQGNCANFARSMGLVLREESPHSSEE